MTVKGIVTQSPNVVQINTFSVAASLTLDGVFPFLGGGEDTHVVVLDGVPVDYARSQGAAEKIYFERLRVRRDHYSREHNR